MKAFFKTFSEYVLATILLLIFLPLLVNLWDNYICRFDSNQIPILIKKLSGGGSPLSSVAVAVPPGADKNEVVSAAKSFLYAPYRFGGSSKNGVDCSGLTTKAFSATGIQLPRSVERQFRVGSYVENIQNLKVGDLVFFATGFTGKATHVGIYVGEYKMIHASSGYGKVLCVRINNSYYRNRFLGGRRVFTK